MPRAGCVLAFLACVAHASAASAVSFTDVTLDAGFTHTHNFNDPHMTTRHMPLAGCAAADFDRDGWVDVYVIRGSTGPNLLYRNLGNGQFVDVAAAAGVDAVGDRASGALFFDANGDGHLDLFVGGTLGTPNRFFVNRGDGRFDDRIGPSQIPASLETFSASAADYDRDGDLDLFLTHWHGPQGDGHLWRNNGHGVFTSVDAESGIHAIGDGQYDFSFTAAFADINHDGWLDILMAGDFETSRVFVSNRDGTFDDATSAVISDENGMGSAVGDYDGDGDLDWFVSSIFDSSGEENGGAWGLTGNRMYRNNGGVLEDATDVSGVREGGWGWASSFLDVDNDGWLDLFHVNGWPGETETFLADPARLFMNAGNGTFVERSESLGVAHTGQGRGVVCFDYDRDGDTDLFITNYRAAPVLLRNDGGNDNAWLSLTLLGRARNRDAIGARVTIEAGGMTLRRDVTCGNNYLSQNPFELTVGLGAAERAERVLVTWPDGSTSELVDVAVRQRIEMTQPAAPPAPAKNLRILSAQPNPFRDSVELTLEGAEDDTTVQVFDVRGRRVRSLNPGATGSIQWDGRDDRGVGAPSGIYWLRVTNAAGSDARRIVLVR